MKIGDKVKIKTFTTYGDKGEIIRLNPSRFCNHDGLFPVIVKTCGGRLPSTEVGYLKNEVKVIK
mgnify:FL=1